jgi:hypothetical protein
MLMEPGMSFLYTSCLMSNYDMPTSLCFSRSLLNGPPRLPFQKKVTCPIF